jgi:hypothetical protein
LLVQGGQLFMQAEAENQDLDFGGFEENLVEAIECYLLVSSAPLAPLRHHTRMVLRVSIDQHPPFHADLIAPFMPEQPAQTGNHHLH